MKLALVGKNIAHSASPTIYKKIIGSQIIYDLIDVSNESLLPSLSDLAKIYDGINITSPYKKFYLSQLHNLSPEALSLGAVNTVSLYDGQFSGINTDYHAVEFVLRRFKTEFSDFHVLILGSGVMANLTQMVCIKNSIQWNQVSRVLDPQIEQLDLSRYKQKNYQLIVINACSRDFIFKGPTDGEEIFWDYNYRFMPHQNTLPFRFKAYLDGQEMLFLQAAEAVKFWSENRS